jgi:hypothetical protein
MATRAGNRRTQEIKMKIKLLLAILALAVLAGTASADTVWTYQGNSSSTQLLLGIPANPCGCALSGFVDVTTGAYSFTDGTHTLTNANSTGVIDPPTSIGTLMLWEVNLTGLDWQIISDDAGSASEQTDVDSPIGGSAFLYVQGNPGTWTGSVATPEPGTLALLAVGLGLLLFKRIS